MKIVKLVARLLLGGALIFAGIGHLTVSRLEFQAQVPVWLPFDPDFVVVASGVVEIALGIGLASAGALVPWSGRCGQRVRLATSEKESRQGNHEERPRSDI